MATYAQLSVRKIDVSAIPTVPLVGQRSHKGRVKPAFVHVPTSRPGCTEKVTFEEAIRRGFAPDPERDDTR